MEKKATAAVASSSSPLPSERRDSSEPKYKGVRKRKWGKWVAEIRLPNSRERIWLGSHDSPEKAARAFDAALYCLRGRGAKFNFPDTPLILGGGQQSLTQQEIQAVAAKFANEGPAGFNHDRTMYGESSSTAAAMEEENNYTSSSSECGAAQGEMNSDVAMDWSFLNTLDHGDYFGMGHHMDGDYYPPPPLPTPDNNGDDGDDQAYSHTSSLWDWKF